MRDRAEDGLLRLSLSGRFRVTAADGTDLTPKGAKVQGLLALLATSPDLCRNRRWLEDKLWSDRGTDQASASLRQALTELRRSLGTSHPVLTSDRQKIGLRRDRVQVDLSTTGDPEFLEGLDVRDPEFESWLRHERHRHLTDAPIRADLWHVAGPALAGPALPAPAAPHARRTDRTTASVVLQKSRNTADGLALMEDLFIDAVALSLREALGITVFTRRQTPGLPNSIAVTVQAMAAGPGERFLRVRAEDGATGQVLWSGRSMALPTDPTPEATALTLFANQVVEVLGDALSLELGGAGDLNAMVLQRLAVRKIWTLDPLRLAEAETLLTLADEIRPQGLTLARRGQLRVLQMVERHGSDAQTLRDEARALCGKAMEREPNNSMVLAVLSYVRCAIDDSPLAGAELAQRSVRLNPGNPLAWDSLSYAHLHAGRIEEAHRIAMKVQTIGAAAPNRFWWDMGLCLTSALTGDLDLALTMARTAASDSPDFRAAQRYVVALGAAADQPGLALAAARRLKALEPDFTMDALAHNPAYPVGVLRRAGLLRSDRIRALGEP